MYPSQHPYPSENLHKKYPALRGRYCYCNDVTRCELHEDLTDVQIWVYRQYLDAGKSEEEAMYHAKLIGGGNGR